jgi:hypothetical protein
MRSTSRQANFLRKHLLKSMKIVEAPAIAAIKPAFTIYTGEFDRDPPLPQLV